MMSSPPCRTSGDPFSAPGVVGPSPCFSSASVSPPLYHPTLYPAYQVDFSHSGLGKHFSSTKRRVSFEFGYASRDAIATGKTGIEARGEEHSVELVWSVLSGKVGLSFDGQAVRGVVLTRGGTEWVKVGWEMGRPAPPSSETVPGFGGSSVAGSGGGSSHTRHIFKAVLRLHPVTGAGSTIAPGPHQRQYDFFIDGRSFFDLPGIYQLGLDVDTRHGAEASSVPAQMCGNSTGPRADVAASSGDGDVLASTPLREEDVEEADLLGRCDDAVAPPSSSAAAAARDFTGDSADSPGSPQTPDPFSIILLPQSFSSEDDEGAAALQQQLPPAAVTASPSVAAPPSLSSLPLSSLPAAEPAASTAVPAESPSSPIAPFRGLVLSPPPMAEEPALEAGAGRSFPAAVPTTAPVMPALAAPQAEAVAKSAANGAGGVSEKVGKGQRGRGGGGMSLSDMMAASSAGHARELQARKEREMRKRAKEKAPAPARAPVSPSAGVSATAPAYRGGDAEPSPSDGMNAAAAPTRVIRETGGQLLLPEGAERETVHLNPLSPPLCSQDSSAEPTDLVEEAREAVWPVAAVLDSDEGAGPVLDGSTGEEAACPPDARGWKAEERDSSAEGDGRKFRLVPGQSQLSPADQTNRESVRLRHAPSPFLSSSTSVDRDSQPDSVLLDPPSSPPLDEAGHAPPDEINMSWLRSPGEKSRSKHFVVPNESYLLNHAKCALCCRDASDVMIDCQCGRKCGWRAHAACLLGRNRGNPVQSVSHPCTPAPALPKVLCGGIWGR